LVWNVGKSGWMYTIFNVPPDYSWIVTLTFPVIDWLNTLRLILISRTDAHIANISPGAYCRWPISDQARTRIANNISILV